MMSDDEVRQMIADMTADLRAKPAQARRHPR
jgi:hypothetical protein